MNVVHIWQDFLTIVTEEVGSRVVETWFKAVTLARWDAATKTVYLKAPNSFVKEWVSGQYTPLIKTHLGRLLNETGINLLFLDESKVAVSTVVEKPVDADQLRGENKGSSKVAPTRPGMNQRYQFDSFVVGPDNEVAFAAAQAVAQQPGNLYNPLYIYGQAGLGKTHLLQAVGNHIKEFNPKARIVYQSADRFVHEFITAIRFDKVLQFEQRYREVDVLLIDDLQLIARKEQTQEAFFHIINALYESQKQIVFSSDSLPGNIVGLAPRLKSRLDGALIVDLQPPCMDTKLAILHKKADLQNEKLHDDVAQFIASRVTNNVRELEGMLIRVLAFATLTHQAVGLDLAHKVLERTTIAPVARIATLDFPLIAQKVAKHYNHTMIELRSASRQKNLVLTRQVAMYFMKKMTSRSLVEIASFLCRKDHTTVMHACEKIEKKRSDERQFNLELLTLESELLR